MKSISRITISGVIAVASLGIGLASSSAQPSDNASCIAQLRQVQGPVGQYQRFAHDPTVGQRIVKYIATFDGDCGDIPD